MCKHRWANFTSSLRLEKLYSKQSLKVGKAKVTASMKTALSC
jgi:hypothetical protein